MQVGVTAFLFGGQHLLRALLPRIDFDALLAFEHLWGVLPPFHHGAWVDLVSGEGGARVLARAGIAVLLPGLALLFAWRLAGRRFGAALAGDIGPRGSPRRWPRGLLLRAGRSLASREGRAGFLLGAALCLRDRTYVREVLPGLIAFSVIIALGVLLGGGRDGMPEALAGLSLHLPGAAGMNALLRIGCGEQHGARRLLAALPMVEDRLLVGGALRAVALRLILPLQALTAAIAACILGPKLLCDALFAVAGGWCVLLWLLPGARLPLPFTQKLDPGGAGASIALPFAILGSLAVLAALHALAGLLPGAAAAFVLAGAGAAAAVLAWRMRGRLDRTLPPATARWRRRPL
jgi:hypothetical protein